MSDDIPDFLTERVAERINADISTFAGYNVRADAGEHATIYVALRQAATKPTVGEQLAERLTPLVEPIIDGVDDALDFAVAMGRSDHDLLLRIEIQSRK